VLFRIHMYRVAYLIPLLFRAERFKTSIQFLNIPYRNIYAALDACKAADYVVFVLSTVVEVDNWGDILLRTLQAQGLPEVVTVVSPSSDLDPKSRPGIMKSLLSFIQYFVPSQTRVFDLHSGSDRLSAVRALAEGKPEDVRWREGRTWIVGEKAEWTDGILAVTGVVRGANLSANRLVHLPDFGDFQIAKVDLKSMVYSDAEVLTH
jgi:pre-rRNA-processing protein TSR1